MFVGLLQKYLSFLLETTDSNLKKTGIFGASHQKHKNAFLACFRAYVGHTVTDFANSCATPLFRRPQGSQGCLEKGNHPLSSNLLVWCPEIGPKPKKV